MGRIITSSANRLLIVLLFSLLLFVPQINGSMSSNRKLGRAPITAKGLSYDFYWISCPRVERIIRKHLEDVFEKDPGQAPGGMLRLFFHDCFSQGCDASIFLSGASGERDTVENFGLRPEAIQTIENLRALVRKQCPRVVSCSDILVIAAREAVRQMLLDFDLPALEVNFLELQKPNWHALNGVGKVDILGFPAIYDSPYFAQDLMAQTGVQSHLQNSQR